MENSLQSAHALKYQDFNMSSSLRIVHHGLSPISDLFFHRQGTKLVLTQTQLRKAKIQNNIRDRQQASSLCCSSVTFLRHSSVTFQVSLLRSYTDRPLRQLLLRLTLIKKKELRINV